MTARFIHLVPLALIAIGATGATILRSPKDAASQPSKRIRKVAPTNSTAAMLPPQPTAIIKRPPHAFHITLMCDPQTNIFGYHWYRGTNSIPNFLPTSGTYTENNWVIQSNLWPGTYYDFAVAPVGSNGVEGNLSPLVHWPQPQTNFVSLGVSASSNGNWSTKSTLVMDQRLANFRLKQVATGYELHSSPSFAPWTTVTNWPASEPLPTFYLRASNWDNVTGKAMPD